MKRVLRARSLLLLLVFVPPACDAFKEPNQFDDSFSDFGGGPPVFCPSATFALATPSAALVGPLFAWVTLDERLDIEAGGEVLPAVPPLGAPGSDHLVAAMHDRLPTWSLIEPPLAGQPRVGRGFWTFAFSAPPASAAHDQLLAIWLRSDAWLAAHAAPDIPVIDANSSAISTAAIDESPGRVAGIDTGTFTDCLRGGFPERSFVVFREEAIERVHFGTEATTRLDAELGLLESILQQVRQDSHLNPVTAFDYFACNATASYALCYENTYVQAVAWTTPTYLPTISALSSLIDQLRATPKGADVSIHRNEPEDLAAWEAVWPGPWRNPETGAGGAGGSGGLGGSGG